MAKDIFQRVADEARPPAIWSRPGCGPPDYAVHVLLDDLVESGVWLDLELKRPFLAIWVNEESFDDPDVDDPIEILTNADAHKFAAMDPVVDLESLRGMRVYHDEPYFR